MKEDLSNQIDLCMDTPKCIESASSNTLHDFVHTPSHTLLRQKSFIHKMHLATFIPACRTRSENIKKRFRTLEENKKIAKKIAKASKSGKSGHASQLQEASDVQPLLCVCCEKEVTLPCWICATCGMSTFKEATLISQIDLKSHSLAADTAVCLECELKRAKIVKYEDRDSMHSHNHFLLRINDNIEVQSREVNNIRLQRELINITTDLRSLEQKVTTHLRAASKVNTVLRRFTVDGEVKMINEHPANDAPAVNGETVAPSAQPAINDDDDDLSDIFGSTYSDNSESEAVASAPSTPLPAEPQELPAESESNGTEGVTSPRSEPEAAESAAEVKEEEAVSLVEAPMETPKPGDVQFFETLATGPDPSEPQNGPDSSVVNAENGHPPKADAALEAASGEPPTQTTKSRRLKSHLVSIGTQISSLDTRMTSVDTRISSVDTRISSLDCQISDVNSRISSLDNRLSGVENQLGEILALLRQGRS